MLTNTNESPTAEKSQPDLPHPTGVHGSEAENPFRNLADHAPVMMWVTEPDGTCSYLNRAWYEFTGQTAEEAEGFGWLDAVHPGDRGWSGETFLAANARREAFQLEYRLRRHDGEYRWAIDAARPRFGPDGEFLGYVGSVTDIGDRRQAEDELRASEDRLRLATEASLVGTWDFNLRTGVLRWDDRCKAVFGLPPSAKIDYDVFLAGLHPEDRERVDTAVRQALSPGGAGEYRVEYRTIGIEDGVERWVASTGRAVFDGEGADRRAVRFIGSALDISERKVTEDRLAEETRTLETLNRTGAALAGELDLERVVQNVTDAGVKLTGAEFGAFFYNVLDEAGESYMLYSLAGVDRAAFANFPMPRATAVFAPTFRGEGVLRSDDITADPRYGKNSPHNGLPEGHLPVRSYLAVPVVSRSGEVIGGLFFGHGQPRQFVERHEKLMVGLAAQAAIAIDNARLFRDAQREIDERSKAEERLRLQGEEFQTLADNMPALCWMARADGHIFWYNQRWYEYTGTTPDSQEGWGWESVHDPEYLPKVSDSWRRSLDSGTPFEMIFPLRGVDGVFRPFLTRIVPIRDESGQIVRWFGTNVDITDQQEAKVALAEALHAKDVLLHEVNHRVKNSLQVVTGLLMLQASQAKDPALRQALMEARGRIAVVAGMHQRLYSTSQHDRVDFGEYVHDLAVETLQSLGGSGRIALKADVEPGITVLLQNAVPLALVVTEIVTNAIKYAFPDGRAGTLRLSLKRDGEEIVIEVADDGVGLPAGFDPNRRSGLGMRIVTSLVKQVRGRLEVSAIEPGAAFRIHIPADRINIG